MTHRPSGTRKLAAATAVALAFLAGLVLVVPLSGVVAARAEAQAVPSVEGAGITVVGEGVAKGAPDVTVVRLGVLGSGKTAAAALTESRAATGQVLQRLRQEGVAEGDLQTTWLQVTPIWGEGRGGPPDPANITGYHGQTGIELRVADAQRVEGLLDAAMDAGATSVEELRFGIRDDAALQRQALETAVKDARPKAEAAAKAAGLTLGAVRSVAPAAGVSAFPADGRGGGGAEGIAPGHLSLTMRAQVTFDVAR